MLLLSKICTTTNIVLGITTAVVMYLFFMTITIGSDLVILMQSQILDMSQTAQAIISVYANPFVYMHVLSFVITIFVCILIGTQAILYRYVRGARLRVIKSSNRQATSTTFVSSLFVALGTGCAACGSLVLMSVLSTLGLGVSLTLTAWISNVLLVAAVLVLLYANVQLFNQAKNPLVCPI